MAENQKDTTRVTQTAEDAKGVSAAQVEPTADRKWADVKAEMTHEPDRDLHPSGEPEHAADRTSIPGPEYPPAERPPVSTTRPDQEILRSLVTGAGKHEPPDPAKYDAEGRPRDI
jgi:hypothetical protein